jgi:hypothetical protein
VTSSCSVESDWSDEEIEELEKIFGHIQVRTLTGVKVVKLFYGRF